MSSRNAKYAYTTVNNLKHYITIRKAEKVAEKGGTQVLIRDIENELADYCQVTRDTILMLKRGVNQPSLAVALKIAEYFGVPAEEIFSLRDTCPKCEGKGKYMEEGLEVKCSECNGSGIIR